MVGLISFDINGQNPKTFSTNEYSQHPHGFYQNNWLPGIALLIAGMVVGGTAFVLPHFIGKKKHPLSRRPASLRLNG